MHRFYYHGSLKAPEIELTGDEAHHLTRVLRLSIGDQIELFDGCEQAVVAEILAVQKKVAVVRVLSTSPAPPPRRPTLTLLTASPKADRLRWLVEKATELGVDRLILLKTERSVVHPGPGKLAKMQATIVAACKQSGRNDLMQIEAPQAWETVIPQLMKETDRLFVATPGGLPIEQQHATEDNPASIAVAIGPEGGWTGEELSLALDRGALPIGLGQVILRTETACLAAACVLRTCYATPE